jgi:hypothetical protein
MDGGEKEEGRDDARKKRDAQFAVFGRPGAGTGRVDNHTHTQYIEAYTDPCRYIKDFHGTAKREHHLGLFSLLLLPCNFIRLPWPL